MKFCISYNKLNSIFLIFLCCINLNFANAEEDIEKNLKDLTLKLRCMTCQNQTIYESDTDFSKDIKKIIRQKLIDGNSKNEISDFLVNRYGEYILFEPRFDLKNIVLWIFPFFAIILSVILLIIYIKKNNISK